MSTAFPATRPHSTPFVTTRPPAARRVPRPAPQRAAEPAPESPVEGVLIEAVEGGHRVTHLATGYRAFVPEGGRHSAETVARNLKQSLDKLGTTRGEGLPTYRERRLGAAMPEGWRWDKDVRVVSDGDCGTRRGRKGRQA